MPILCRSYEWMRSARWSTPNYFQVDGGQAVLDGFSDDDYIVQYDTNLNGIPLCVPALLVKAGARTCLYQEGRDT